MLGLIQKLKIAHYRKKGLQISSDCRLMGTPFWGSEPYLISIGKHVTISGRVTFITHDGATFVFRHLPEYRDVTKFGRITIHDNCFIGFGAILLPGISIGPNSVVAAGSIVASDVPPNTVVGGNPARVLKGVEDYANKCLMNTPDYDRIAYKYNKKRELLRIFPYPW